MTLVERAFIQAARVRRKLGRPSRAAFETGRRRWIAEHTAGKSFADIGGLYGIDGEFAFLAEASGATRVTCLDHGDPTEAYLAEHARRDSSVRLIQGDVEDPVIVERIGVHDVVFCSGVIYHTPNPVQQLIHLRRITGELLYLGSHTIAEVPGVRQACVYYPMLPEDSRLAHELPHWKASESGAGALGGPFIDTPMLGHANFWWGITSSALRAIVRTACFEIVQESRVHGSPWFTVLICRPVDRAPSLPPVDYYRRRGEAREAGEPPLPFERYYDQ